MAPSGSLDTLDYGVIALYLFLTLSIGLLFSKKGSASIGDFFLSGRKLPWWIAGTGMVATTFAADTPLAVTGLVARHGIAGNWVWWTFVSGGMLTVFFFARLWRRAEVLTDLEFIELRYEGRPAGFLRGFKALYFGLFMNAVIIGWVNLAMLKIVTIMMPGLDSKLTIVGLVLLTTLYSGLSGLWGVTITDTIQFVVAMAGCTILAVLAVHSPEVQSRGGLEGALEPWMFEFFPTIGASGTEGDASGAFALPFASFAAMAFVQWWASWYPGAEPGGGGYIAQRMMSAKDEKHSLLATLWFTIAHYCLRPWPWIIVALASLVMFPDLPTAQKEDGFVHVMQAVLPSGLRGLLVASFLAAYMSTLSTHLNWGASYLVNDAYRRFLRKDGSARHYVVASKLVTVLIALISLWVTFWVLESITGAWEFIIQCGAGTGFVLILRWFWWRLNAWSEITSMAAPFIAYGYLYAFTDIGFPHSIFLIVAFTITMTLLATFLTRPVSRQHLEAFYRKTRVGGALWKPVAAPLGNVGADTGFLGLFLDWALGIALVYCVLFGTGRIIFGQTLEGVLAILAGLLFGGLILADLERRGWKTLN